ncbi:hypothetical protein BESB_003230 [Besnoitia besnoiti]|uniref:Uncharacterized protein n=1 Tax=Besnoitia besnoiti TaxID=94643 RepID=A0A2A9MQ08_BESBE|nr:hypothetical protein BESB_003230 [Besnoitia besnoiti]PFH37982.1 hypothetical protein BESB_003230 [Besnoitia besnoiti]
MLLLKRKAPSPSPSGWSTEAEPTSFRWSQVSPSVSEYMQTSVVSAAPDSEGRDSESLAMSAFHSGVPCDGAASLEGSFCASSPHPSGLPPAKRLCLFAESLGREQSVAGLCSAGGRDVRGISCDSLPSCARVDTAPSAASGAFASPPGASRDPGSQPWRARGAEESRSWPQGYFLAAETPGEPHARATARPNRLKESADAGGHVETVCEAADAEDVVENPREYQRWLWTNKNVSMGAILFGTSFSRRRMRPLHAHS